MKAMERITDAEAAAERERKLAIQQNHSQGRYEIGIQSCESTLIVGAEYTLCMANALLMSAIVSFLNESVIETLKGAYNIRKSYQLLHKLSDMIVLVESRTPVDSNEG